MDDRDVTFYVNVATLVLVFIMFCILISVHRRTTFLMVSHGLSTSGSYALDRHPLGRKHLQGSKACNGKTVNVLGQELCVTNSAACDKQVTIHGQKVCLDQSLSASSSPGVAIAGRLPYKRSGSDEPKNRH